MSNGDDIKAKRDFLQEQALQAGQYTTLCKLYLELANIVPKDCISSREIRLGKVCDTYGLALLMIAEGIGDPSAKACGCQSVARSALDKVKAL